MKVGTLTDLLFVLVLVFITNNSTKLYLVYVWYALLS